MQVSSRWISLIVVAVAASMPPDVRAQYTTVTTAVPATTTTTTQSANTAASMGQPAQLSAAPNLPSLSNYLSIGTFISGNSFPNSTTGPIYMIYLGSTLAPATAVTNFGSILSSSGWTVDSSGSSAGSVSGTLGNSTCNVTVKKAYGINKSRIYIDYRVNSTPAPTTTTTTSTPLLTP